MQVERSLCWVCWSDVAEGSCSGCAAMIVEIFLAFGQNTAR